MEGFDFVGGSGLLLETLDVGVGEVVSPDLEVLPCSTFLPLLLSPFMLPLMLLLPLFGRGGAPRCWPSTWGK